MKKNFVVINSNSKINKIVIGFLEEFIKKDFFVFFIFSDKSLSNFFKDKNWPSMKIFLGPKINNRLKSILFLLLLPILRFFHFFVVLFLKLKYKPQAIICQHESEKIIYTPLAKIFKIKTIWIEDSDNNYPNNFNFFNFVLRKCSKNAKIITFLESSKLKLKRFGMKGEIEVIAPGVKQAVFWHQENIFSNLVKADSDKNKKNKYFTLGFITDFTAPNQIENLFRAINICLTIIPNIQIVIVGDGQEKKQVMWNNKKIGLENYTWFVGRQDNLRRWLDSFDIYVAVNEKPNDLNLQLILKAMFASLPIILFSGNGQEDLINENQNGLICEPGDPDMLAQIILKLFKNKDYRLKIGENAKKYAEENFDIKSQFQKFVQILEN